MAISCYDLQDCVRLRTASDLRGELLNCLIMAIGDSKSVQQMAAQRAMQMSVARRMIFALTVHASSGLRKLLVGPHGAAA
ncbi:hypothetical protein EVJ58_g319 [Rhodofomes roseus]|uniref:Uncharacterized protein n=1 Tax=Rhodofomes roseus TaxID=34475 RepID=A0A4Y9Z764_9APHY|nr:hypothetical protein EVJ58_g319 [Rhodofomes roseus]